MDRATGPDSYDPRDWVIGIEGQAVDYIATCWQANARLIAAAPDLLKELSHLVRLLEPYEQSGSLNVPGLATLNGARVAITKATGESS